MFAVHKLGSPRFASVVAVARLVPDFQTFTGLVGSFFLPVLGFVLPVVLFEKVVAEEPLRSLGHVAIAVFGVARPSSGPAPP